MKVYKLTAQDYRDLPCLLQRVGATQGNRAYPGHVYCSRRDLARMKSELTRLARGQFPGASARAVANTVGMEMLNYSPSSQLETVLKPGWVVVDEAGITREKESEKTVVK